MSDSDKLVEQLLAKVQAKKNEIKKLEKPSYRTNCTFATSPTDINSKRVNLHVCNLDSLTDILTILIVNKDAYDKAAKELGNKKTFEWAGYSYEDWLEDIKTSAARFSIAKKKSELESLEKKLNLLVSPEQRRQMELAEIAKSLDDED